MDEMTLTLSSPITEEQFDAITDVDFDNTDRIWFHTKHGKDVEFVKQRTGKWKMISPAGLYECSKCGQNVLTKDIDCYKFCHGCGCEMRGVIDDQS